MKKVFIISAKRTAVGSFLGSLSKVSPVDLGAALVKNIFEETGVNPSTIDEVIVGNVLSAGQKQGVGRQVSINSGIPVEVPGYSVNILCGSGMKSVMLAANDIKLGEAELVFAGGIESMSLAPYLQNNIRTGNKMGEVSLKDHIIVDGLTDAFTGIHMGITAENIATKYNISREEQDKFAADSQKKAIAAIDSGKFKDEIVPLEVKIGKETVMFSQDEYPNRKTNLEKLGGLRPAFKKDGTVTAGNASGVNDGAAIILLASEEAVKKYNLKPLAEVVGYAQGGVAPEVMGLGPVPAIDKVLKKIGMSLNDMDLIELNEAFAAQSLGVVKELAKMNNITEESILEKTNVNGGAIALGHPIGASGARIIVTLIHEMKKRNSKYGLGSLCIGGGMGTSIVLKNIK
ncbi:MAG: acetyl-CoA C-acetyltransferase [Fusobacteriaceae bacterium]